MPRTYRVTSLVRLVNGIVGRLIRLGIGPPHHYLLTVRGRCSGKPYTTPVVLVEEGSQRWLVSPYGEVNWVLNARAAGEVTLTRGSRSASVGIEELGAKDAAPVLSRYLRLAPITRPYFAAGASASLLELEAEAHRHPVFKLGDIG